MKTLISAVLSLFLLVTWQHSYLATAQASSQGDGADPNLTEAPAFLEKLASAQRIGNGAVTAYPRRQYTFCLAP